MRNEHGFTLATMGLGDLLGLALLSASFTVGLFLFLWWVFHWQVRLWLLRLANRLMVDEIEQNERAERIEERTVMMQEKVAEIERRQQAGV